MEQYHIDENLKRLNEERIIILDIISNSGKMEYQEVKKYREILSKLNTEISCLRRKSDNQKLQMEKNNIPTYSFIPINPKPQERASQQVDDRYESELANIFNQISHKSKKKKKLQKKM